MMISHQTQKMDRLQLIQASIIGGNDQKCISYLDTKWRNSPLSWSSYNFLTSEKNDLNVGT